MAPKVEIYTWSSCPFCIRAKALLKQKGVEFTEYCIDGDEQARTLMAQRANGQRSVPQIFINDQHIGGCDDAYELEAQGKLDQLLQAGPKVEIYTWSSCPFCIRAKALLKQKGVEFTEYCIDGDEQARTLMARRANGRRSLPQIFINDQHIGGCDDTYELEAQGELDQLLQAG